MNLNSTLTIFSMAVTAVSLSKQSNFIQQNWKPIIGLSATAGVMFLGWKIYKGLTPPAGGIGEDARFEPAKITDGKAQLVADVLHTAMKTLSTVNERELAQIKKALTGLNYNDYVKVSKFFGERRYVDITGVGGIYPATPRNLSYWLSKELDADGKAAISLVIPNIF